MRGARRSDRVCGWRFAETLAKIGSLARKVFATRCRSRGGFTRKGCGLSEGVIGRRNLNRNSDLFETIELKEITSRIKIPSKELEVYY